MKFVLSEFEESLVAMNHLFMNVKIWFDDSTRWHTSGSVITLSANRTGMRQRKY
jgi:hypothetical protein